MASSSTSERILRSTTSKRLVTKVQSASVSNSPTTSLDPNSINPSTPAKQEANPTIEVECAYLLSLPDEILERIVILLNPCQLASLESCGSHRLRDFLNGEVGQAHWATLFDRAYGPITDIQIEAVNLAKSWKNLYASKYLAELTQAPWKCPSSFEVHAAIDRLIPTLEGTSRSTCIVFLVDGSGSVTEEDFNCMSNFMLSVRHRLVSTGCSDCQLSVIQFSNDTRVELEPVDLVDQEFDNVVENMNRMNGGTNINVAIIKAGQMLKPLPPSVSRVLVILTDGRIDSYQAREAAQMSSRLADEQGDVMMHAFGVGRGVDKHELLKIIGGGDVEGAEGRYLPLRVLDEAPW